MKDYALVYRNQFNAVPQLNAEQAAAMMQQWMDWMAQLNKNGQLVWVADQYIDRALLPQTPVPFNIHIPEDLARKISTERTVTATYSVGRLS